jgi:RNA polymerase sigma factor (sigma-70 family)
VVRLAALLLDGDTAAAGAVARDLLTAWGRLGDPEKAHVYLRQAVVNMSRSVRRHRAIDSRDAAQAVPSAPGAELAGHGSPDRDPWISALRSLPDRQREAVVLRHYPGLSEKQAAQAMGISIGAIGSHLARGMSSLQRPPRPE